MSADPKLDHSFARRSPSLAVITKKSGPEPLPRATWGSRIVGRSVHFSTEYGYLIFDKKEDQKPSIRHETS